MKTGRKLENGCGKHVMVKYNAKKFKTEVKKGIYREWDEFVKKKMFEVLVSKQFKSSFVLIMSWNEEWWKICIRNKRT